MGAAAGRRGRKMFGKRETRASEGYRRRRDRIWQAGLGSIVAGDGETYLPSVETTSGVALRHRLGSLTTTAGAPACQHLVRFLAQIFDSRKDKYAAAAPFGTFPAFPLVSPHGAQLGLLPFSDRHDSVTAATICQAP